MAKRLDESSEDVGAIAARAERTVEAGGDALRPDRDPRAERQTGARQAGAAGREPALAEAEAGEGGDDADEREQFGTLLELARAGDAGPVGRGRGADLLQLVGGQDAQRVEAAPHGDEGLRDRRVELRA